MGWTKTTSKEPAPPSTPRTRSFSHNSHKHTPTVWRSPPNDTSAATVATTAITTGDHRPRETGAHSTPREASAHAQQSALEQHLPTVNTPAHGTPATTDDKSNSTYTITTTITTTPDTTVLHTVHTVLHYYTNTQPDSL